MVTDLDTLPFPAFDLQPGMDALASFSLEMGRGCPFSCTFCSTNDFFRRRFRLKSPEKILAQMRRAKREYNATRFDLVHDMFTVDRKRVAAFCQTMLDSGENFLWGCSARTDCVDDELIDLMYRARVPERLFRRGDRVSAPAAADREGPRSRKRRRAGIPALQQHGHGHHGFVDHRVPGRARGGYVTEPSRSWWTRRAAPKACRSSIAHCGAVGGDAAAQPVPRPTPAGRRVFRHVLSGLAAGRQRSQPDCLVSGYFLQLLWGAGAGAGPRPAETFAHLRAACPRTRPLGYRGAAPVAGRHSGGF